MRAGAEREAVLALVAAGVNDCEIARRTGVPRTTVRDWRCPRYLRREPRLVCPRCWGPVRRPATFTSGDYAELLGLYLGDGDISRVGRVMRLRITLDLAHPGIVVDTADLLVRSFPHSSVGVTPTDRSCVAVWVYSAHLPCLFPQHGPGLKHDRRIVLEPWQWAHVEAAPWRFLRGCIRSDGCVYINRTGRYEYLGYDFSNRSADIKAIFAQVCGMVGVECRVYANYVRIHRRPSVEQMRLHVGPKR